MTAVPRFAVGAVQSGVDRRLMMWALLEALSRGDTQVQGFASRACFPDDQAVTVITGLKLRYLDSWLMGEAVCREVFAHGSQLADLSVVDGEFRSENAQHATGGDLETLCRWLRLPRIVLLDTSKITGAIPERPAEVDAVLLDRVADSHKLAQWTTDVETVWRVPVVGSLPASPEWDRRLVQLSPGRNPCSEWLRELGDELSRSWRPELLHRLSQVEATPPVEARLFKRETATLRLTVAVAFDEAFCCYFPCMLDMLEARGATIVDFSPLRDEHLPPQCDIVLLGSGHPQRHAMVLSENHCMKTALRNHVLWGRRIYGEGGGLTFLCQHMVTEDGQFARMAGLLPAIVRAESSSEAPVPVEATLPWTNWLEHAGEPIRGYRNRSWAIEPLGELCRCDVEEADPVDMIGSFQTVGSLLEIHFGAQTNLLNHFFYPHKTPPANADPWLES